jgi:hypothetical protein
MTEPEFFHRRPPDGFDVGGWVDAALRAGMRFSVDRNGELMRWLAMREVDPGPELAWLSLSPEMDHHGHEIRAEIRRRIEELGEVEEYPDAEDPEVLHVYRTIRGTPCLDA